jgi:predicted dehydrogenase
MVLRVGMLGAGLIARYHAASLRRSGAAAVLGPVYDPETTRSKELVATFGGQAVSDENAVVEGSDAVFVCTWTSEHPRLVDLACRARRAVFCEKPLATDLPGARAMTAAVTRAGVVNQVGLVLRSTPGFALLRHLVTDPDAGRIVSVVFRDDQQIPLGGYYASEWRADRRRAGAGTLLEHSIHDLDLIEWLAGPIAVVSAHAGNLHGHEGIEDTVGAAFVLEGGATGALTSVWHDVPGRLSSRHLEIFCERGRFWADGNAAEVVGWELEAGRGEERSGPGLIDELARRGAPCPTNADAAFVEAVASGRPASPDFATALRAHVLVDAVYRSAAAGGGAAAPG